LDAFILHSGTDFLEYEEGSSSHKTSNLHSPIEPPSSRLISSFITILGYPENTLPLRKYYLFNTMRTAVGLSTHAAHLVKIYFSKYGMQGFKSFSIFISRMFHQNLKTSV